jgi:diguanylate cyclase (GGDEF)-like protein
VNIEVHRHEEEPVSIRLGGYDFPCEDESGATVVPRKFLGGYRLSEIPEGIIIKPVESVEGHVIHVTNDIGLTRFTDGRASGYVEEMFRRKFWDGEVGLSPYVGALRAAIAENAQTQESDFSDDGDYIFLHYEVAILHDSDIGDAISAVETIITLVQTRTEHLVNRRRDSLLNIFDRGSFDADLADSLLSSGDRVGLLMADVDRFKMVNDTYGHPVGDEVLRSVARVLSANCNGTAAAYRYGGEELAIILPGADVATVSHLAELIRAQVEALVFSETPVLKTTISIGIAVAPEDAGNADELVKRADGALYRAKQEGRNCVRTANQIQQ